MSKLSTDALYMGKEPVLEHEPSVGELAKVINWYNYIHGQDKAIEYTLAYMSGLEKKMAKNDKIKKIIKKIPSIPKSKFPSSIGWILRQASIGSKIPNEEIDKAIGKLMSVIPDDKNSSRVSTPKTKTIKERPYLEELEHLIDVAVSEKFKKIPDVKGYISSVGNIGFNADDVIGFYVPLRAELKEAIEGKCPQLKEAYSRYNKKELQAYHDLIQSIIVGAESTKFVQAVSKRKPRKTKPKTADKLVKGMSYKEFDTELELKSELPEKCIGVSQIWTYNTVSGKLAVFNFEKGASVKGASFIGYDEKTSFQKKLRKPKDILKLLKETPKAGLKKFMEKNVKTVAGPVGRMTKDTIIVRIVK